jgi:NAD-dependent DNA ligase
VSWTEADFLVGSSLLPRGVGHRKLAPLFAAEADPRKWARVIQEAPDGWTAKSLEELIKALPAAVKWREETFGWIPYRVQSAAGSAPGLVVAGTVVFTGVRDKELEGAMTARGWMIGDSVTKATTLLIVADGAAHDTGKGKKATALGIKIQNLSQSRAEWIP